MIKKCLFIRSRSGLYFGLDEKEIVTIVSDVLSSHVDIRELDDRKYIHYDGDLIPVLSLDEIFPIGQDHLEVKSCINEQDKYICLLKAGKQIMAITTNEVLEIEDAVIKQIPLNFIFKQSVDGVSFLGENHMAYIINNEKCFQFLVNENLLNFKSKHLTKIEKLKDDNYTSRLLLFSWQEEVYAIEADMVLRVDKRPSGEFHHVLDESFWRYDNQLIPLMSIAQNSQKKFTNFLEKDEIGFVMIKTDRHLHDRLIAVDEIIDLINHEMPREEWTKLKRAKKPTLFLLGRPYLYLNSMSDVLNSRESFIEFNKAA